MEVILIMMSWDGGDIDNDDVGGGMVVMLIMMSWDGGGVENDEVGWW